MIPTALRCLAPFLLAASLAATAASEPATSDIDELMVKSGLWVQVAQIGPSVEQGIDQQAAQDRARGKPGLTDTAMARLKASAKKAFATDRLRKETRDVIAELMKPEDIRDVLVWLNSELGTRITRLEESQGASPDYEAAAKLQEAVKAHAATLQPERLKLIRAFVKATRSAEATADLVINSMTAVMVGIGAVTPLGDKTSARDLQKRMEAQREPLTRAFETEALAQYGYVYRTLADTELQKYLAFAESPAGERYHSASTVAMQKVYVQATYAFSMELGVEATKEKPSPS